MPAGSRIFFTILNCDTHIKLFYNILSRQHSKIVYRAQILSVKLAKYGEIKQGAHLGVFGVNLSADGCLESYEEVTEMNVKPASVPDCKAELVVFDVITQQPSAWQNDGTYLDTMNPDAVGEFIRQTHEKYKGRFEKDFGGLIPAIFTDEPNYGYWSVGRKGTDYQCLWTCHLREEFIKRCGYDLVPYLPEIVFVKSSQDFSKVRYDYFKTISELFVESFTKQIGTWCQDNSLPLTGHVLWEEPLNPQVSAVGSCMPHYEYMQWPGVDMLMDQSKQLATVKQCTSVADQLGKERVLSELYGCTGWDWPLEGHKFMADWQFAGGVNFLCPHLSHYSLAGGAKRDYPASILDHTPWWPYYKTVQDYVSRLSYMLTQGKPLRDVLVIHPIESTWGLYDFNRTCEDDFAEKLQPSLKSIIYGLTEHHYDWDFGDESLIAKYAEIDSNRLIMRNMQYRVVIIPPVITLRSTTLDILDRFVASGGSVICVSPLPNLVDGLPSQRLDSLFAKSLIREDSKAMITALEKMLPRRVSIKSGALECERIWTLLRQIGNSLMIFMQSQDRKECVETTVKIRNAQSPVIFWDALTGQKKQVAFKISADGVEFTHKFDPSGSAIFTFGIDVPDAQPVCQINKVIKSEVFGGPFEVELTEPNTLPLDYCRFKFGTGGYSDLLPVLKVDEIMRKGFGLSTRFGLEQQPYYLYTNKKIDTRPRGIGELIFPFHVTEIPESCSLVLENPADFQIKVNGNCVTEVNGFWVDEDFKTISIHDYLLRGANEISLKFNYRTDMELEDMYLTGDFSVQKIDSTKSQSPKNMTLARAVKTLKLGSWVGQGLDFYSGSVKYKIPFKPHTGRSNRTCVRLEKVSCTAAAVHVGTKTVVLPWAPFVADITDAIGPETREIIVEVIGGRKNILGPLHVPNLPWTGPDCFHPDNAKWTFDYQLNHHGLNTEIIIDCMV